ncbi:MAG: acetyl-CoA decarbonylase/synthase complex subunit delta [bacterium]|nr:acetyl-CoA decarbonylase/synthase complex subunit delta [bacterium]
MQLDKPLKNWSGKIGSVTVGKNGNSIQVGGDDTLPFHHFEGTLAHKPVIAFEVQDVFPENWHETVKKPWKDCLNDPVEWAKTAVEKYQAEMICLSLIGTHPDRENRSTEETVELVENVSSAVDVPLIIKGPGLSEKQNDVLNKCGAALSGKGCILSSAETDDYKTITATCQAYGHTLVAESPIDVNIAKQLNILISDMGFHMDKVLIDPMTGSLGYGLEYTYSVMERIRLQALAGDTMLQMPFICYVGQETWRVKEVKVTETEQPLWGDIEKRGIDWEAATAITVLLSGANILVMRHPDAVQKVRESINELRK